MSALNVPASLTLADMLRSRAASSPAGEALVFPDASCTYAELLQAAEKRARELSALGVQRGDRVGVLMPNAPAVIELLFAAALIGATFVPINTRFKARELRHVITNAELTVLFTTDVIDEHVNFKTLLREALPELAAVTDPLHLELADAPALRCIALVGEAGADGFASAAALQAAAASESAPAGSDGAGPDDVALFLYTSGTTAQPKGCKLTHSAILLDATGIAERFQIPAEDRWWDPLPMFHGGALMLMTGCFVAGATFVSMARFDPDEAFDLIERERITVLYPLFPTITLSLVHHPRFQQLDRTNIRVVANVAPDDVQRRVQDAFAPAKLISAYGITELCGTVTFNELSDPEATRLTTCGVPLPGFELRVVDPETGAPVPPGTRGELIGRGPSRFSGYHGAPEQTAAVIDADGYFHTGDLCSLDDDGRLRFHGRLKDMLKVGGENVAAVEIESFLATHPAIKLAQVVGVPDDRLLEVPAAFVELAPGAELDAAQVIGFCHGQIASFKVPQHVRFVTEWPMSATKVQKFRLRDQLLEELA